MITGEVKTEYIKPDGEYRKLEGLNQSMLKVWDENPIQFYNEFILGKARKDKGSYALRVGDLTDFLLLECGGNEDEFNQRIEEKFSVFTGVKSTKQAFTLADILFDLTERDRNEEGEILSSFLDRFKEALNIVQTDTKKPLYKNKTVESALEDFTEVAGEYFKKRMDSIGKTVVDLNEIDKAKFISNQLRNDEFLGWMINPPSHLELITKIPIEFPIEMGGAKWNCKAEVDFMHIDHNKKVIFLNDLKTTYDNESFEYNYLKNYYYIQNAFYNLATKHWAIENGMADYKVTPMTFLVLDTSFNNRRPLAYKTSVEHVENGLNGFTFRDSFYKGVIQLVSEITWANENNVWNISKENYENRGIVTLKKIGDGR